MIFQIIAAVICCCIFCFFLGAALAKSTEEPPKEQVKCENCTYRDVCLIEEDLKLVQENPKERYCSLALKREGEKEMIDEKEIMRRVVETCGGEHQERILLEELLELSIAILHKRRGRTHNMAEEIADVEIAMEEVKIAYGLHDEVSAYREAKLNRLSQELRLNQTLELFSGREEGENHGREENPCALPLHGL